MIDYFPSPVVLLAFATLADDAQDYTLKYEYTYALFSDLDNPPGLARALRVLCAKGRHPGRAARRRAEVRVASLRVRGVDLCELYARQIKNGFI